MGTRTTVDFSEKIGPLFKKYANTYSVKNTCSLGVVLIDRLTPEDRERLMGLVAMDMPLDEIELVLRQIDGGHFEVWTSLQKKGKRRIYLNKST